MPLDTLEPLVEIPLDTRHSKALVLDAVIAYFEDPDHWNKGSLRKQIRRSGTWVTAFCMVGALNHFNRKLGIRPLGRLMPNAPGSVYKVVADALPWYAPSEPSCSMRRKIQLFNDWRFTSHRTMMRVLRRARASIV